MTMKDHKYKIISTYLRSIINRLFLFIDKKKKIERERERMLFVIDLRLPDTNGKIIFLREQKKEINIAYYIILRIGLTWIITNGQVKIILRTYLSHIYQFDQDVYRKKYSIFIKSKNMLR